MNNRAIHGRRHLTNADRLDMIVARLGAIERTLFFLIRQGAFEMATLNEIVAAVEAADAVDASAITLLEQISQMLKDGMGDPAAMQAVVDMLDRSKGRMADAIVANTPAANPPPPPPPVNP